MKSAIIFQNYKPPNHTKIIKNHNTHQLDDEEILIATLWTHAINLVSEPCYGLSMIISEPSRKKMKELNNNMLWDFHFNK
jgi:hypothetical protein